MSSGFTGTTRRIVTVAILGAVSSASAGAQAASGTVRGRVTEAASQRPVTEAQVTVTGTTLGAATNAAGEYVITNVPAGAREVVVRRLGYGRRNQTVTVPSAGEVRADFALTQAASQLEAVVVTGTGGAVERRTVGNAITTVNVAELTAKQSVVNVTEVLKGKTPGVTIMPGSGAPGTAGEIRIRGTSSLSGYKPVVFIDGIRYNIDDLGSFAPTGGGTIGLAQSSQVTSALNNLNPNDIESIEVIKGPAAATLYGAEAANGVIQIITKKGTRGQQRLSWTLRGERGWSDWHLLPEDNYTTCDAVKIAQLDTLSLTPLTTTPRWPGCNGVADNRILTDNPLRRDPQAVRTGDLARVSMSLRGGGDRYAFYLAGDRDIEQGVFFNSDNARTSVRANFGFNPHVTSDVQINVNWQDGRLRLPIQDESANGLLLSARRGQPGRRRPEGFEGWSIQSPVTANRYKNFTEDERLTMAATVNYNPFRWLQNRLTGGLDNTATEAQLLFLPGEIEPSQDPDAAIGANLKRTLRHRVLTLDYATTARWSPRRTIETTTQIGSQVVSDQIDTLSARGIGIGAADVTLINLLQRSAGGEGFGENNSVGYYVQEQVAWRDRLFVTGAVRADDHSSFGENFDLIIYPKFSVSYVISDEPAAKRFLDAAQFTTLKLRSAWGQAGRAPTAYAAAQTYTPDRVILGTGVGSALRTASYGNPDLRPERGTELELGFDAGLFGDRLGADFTFYDKTTTDLLQSISVPPSTGFISTRLVNFGKVSNRGIELSLFGMPVRGDRVVWDTRLNVATNRNKLVSFGIAGRTIDTPSGQAYGSVQQHRVGYPMGAYWVTPPLRCGIDQPPPGVQVQSCDGLEGAAMLTTAGAAIFNPGDTARRYIGPSSPTREIGFSNTVTLFGVVRLYGLLDYKGGHYLFNLQERNRCQAANDNCSRTNNPRARFPQTTEDRKLANELAVYRSTSVSPEWIQKADFIKLREISVTFDVPARYIRTTGAQTASIVLSGRNLAVWTDYEGVDPEVNSYGGRNFVRVDAYAMPMTRRLSAAMNLTF